MSAKWPPARAVSLIVILGRHRLPALKIPVPDKALRRRRHPSAGVADRAGSKFFKAVQSGSKFEVRAFKVCSDFSNFAPPEAQEYRLRSDFLEQPRTRLRNATLPRRCPDRGRRRAMATGIRQVEAPQAQTLRFFRLLRLLGPPPSSKPQRLLAATGPEPTLAADSVLGARHQLPDVVSTKGRLTRNPAPERTEHPPNFSTMNPIHLSSTDYQYGLPSRHGNEAKEPSSK